MASGPIAVASAAAPPSLQAVVRSQIPDASIGPDGISLIGTDPAAQLRAALQMRRWSLAGPATSPGAGTAFGVARGASPEAAVAAARRLAEGANGAGIATTAELLDGYPALAGTPLDSGPGTVELRWAGPGRPPISLPLPGPIQGALDRPWALLGREDELEQICRCWARAVQGSGSLTLVGGEPGAGKSRLAAEVAREVHRAGGMVLYGSGEGSSYAPFAPFAEAVGDAVRYGPPEFAERIRASPFGRVTLGGLEERRALADSLGDERGGLFNSAIEGLGRVGEIQPVLIVIDDLHACGSASLQLVDRLAQTAPSLRLMVLATYRPTELDPRDRNAGTVAELGSRPGTLHLELGQLPDRALIGIAAGLDPQADGPELASAAQAVGRDTAGNALFACELLRAGLGVPGSPAVTTPRSLRVLIVSRTRNLGDAALEHLSAAAVAGRRFEPEIVAMALGVEEGELLDSIGRGERAGLLTLGDDGTCTFTHAITARSLVDEIGLLRQTELHGRIAAAIEQRDGPEADPARLAAHWERAGARNEARASELYARAGQRALDAYDHEGAAESFSRALELHDRSSEDQAGRCDLLIGLGRARRFSGDTDYREILLEAARLADQLDDANRLAEAALANHRGFVSLVGGLDRERLAMLERAADRLDAPGPERCLVLAQLALERTFSADLESRRALAAEALELARKTGDSRILARVLIRYLIAGWGPDNTRERIEAAAESIAISSELGEQLDLFHGLHWRAAAQVENAEIVEAQAALREQERIAARVGDPTAQWLCECAGTLLRMLRGDLDGAEEAADRAFGLAQQSSQPDAVSFYATSISAIRWQQGRLPELAPLLDEALVQNPGLPSFASLVALANALDGNRARAAAVVRAAAADGFAGLPRDPVWLAAVATYAHAAAELGDQGSAEILHALLEPHRNRLVSTSVSAWGLAGHALGRLELTLGQQARGERSIGAAIETYERIGAPVWRVQAAIDLLAGSETEPDPEERSPWIAEAERVASELGAELPLIKARSLGAPPASSVLERRIAGLGLTNRQREVAYLLTEGRTNSEIAAELQISTSTVKRHAENIYGRAGVQGRAALTAALLRPR